MDFIKREFTFGEKLFSSVTSGVGGLLAIAGGAVMIVMSVILGFDVYTVIASCLFSAFLIIVFVMSTLANAMTPQKAIRLFNILYHSFSLALISSIYTFLVFLYKPTYMWVVFGIVWGISSLATVLAVLSHDKYKKICTYLYIVMVLGIIAMWDIILILPLISKIFALVSAITYFVASFLFKKTDTPYLHSVSLILAVVSCTLLYFTLLAQLLIK